MHVDEIYIYIYMFDTYAEMASAMTIIKFKVLFLDKESLSYIKVLISIRFEIN